MIQDMSFSQGILGKAYNYVAPDGFGESFAYGVLGLSAASGAVALAHEQIGIGLLSAFGADYNMANNLSGTNYGPVSINEARRNMMFGKLPIMAEGLKGGLASSVPQGRMPNAFSPAGKQGLYPGNPASVVLGTGLSILFGVQAANEGPEAFRKFVAQEIFANYSGLMHSEHFTKQGQNVVSAPRTVLGKTFGGRVTSTLGAYIGSSIGYDIGASIGGYAFGMINENLETPGKFIGALGGTAISSEVGAYAFRGAREGMGLRAFGRFAGIAAGGALLMQGVSTAYRGLYATLKTGFQQKRKMRGLDFAGDPTSFYTQRATTMRQRAVQAMNRSHMNARSAFGQEAQLMHTHRDTFSTYRRM